MKMESLGFVVITILLQETPLTFLLGRISVMHCILLHQRLLLFASSYFLWLCQLGVSFDFRVLPLRCGRLVSGSVLGTKVNIFGSFVAILIMKMRWTVRLRVIISKAVGRQ